MTDYLETDLSILEKPKFISTKSKSRHKVKRTPATSLCGRIPTMNQDQAICLRSLFGARKHWRLRDGSELRLHPAASPAESVLLDADGDRVRIWFDPGMTTAKPEFLRWTGYTGRSRLLAWGLAHEAALIRMSEALRMPLVPMEDSEDQLDLQSLWVDARIDSATKEHPLCRATVRLSLTAIRRLLESSERSGDKVMDWGSLPLPIAIRLLGPRLPANDWRCLHLGDVVVLGKRDLLPPPMAFTDGFAWPLVACEEGWRIDRPSTSLYVATQEISTMNDQNLSEALHNNDLEFPGKNGIQPPVLPVQIDFSIAQITLNMSDFSALQPGYIFALPCHLEGANITIRANGREAARGEVVAVGETLGVRLLSWS
jgi:type III secretion protein Q